MKQQARRFLDQLTDDQVIAFSVAIALWGRRRWRELLRTYWENHLKPMDGWMEPLNALRRAHAALPEQLGLIPHGEWDREIAARGLIEQVGAHLKQSRLIAAAGTLTGGH